MLKSIEVNKDVTFDEEVAFQRSREVLADVDMEELETPCNDETPIPDSPRTNVQREELDAPVDLVDPMETIEPLERPIDAPPLKRRLAWL